MPAGCRWRSLCLQLRMHFLSGMHRKAECDLSELRRRTGATSASRRAGHDRVALDMKIARLFSKTDAIRQKAFVAHNPHIEGRAMHALWKKFLAESGEGRRVRAAEQIR